MGSLSPDKFRIILINDNLLIGSKGAYWKAPCFSESKHKWENITERIVIIKQFGDNTKKHIKIKVKAQKLSK